MQFASFQLEVEARRVADADSRAAMQEMAIGFRQMIEAQKHLVIHDMDAVADAAGEVRDTRAALAASHAAMRPGFSFEWLIDIPARWTVSPAGVLALIVSELVSNAFKHAGSTRGSGHLLVSLTPAAHGMACLTVLDNGAGFNARLHSAGGMGLVGALAQAIGGDVSVSGRGESVCRVRVLFAIEA